MTYDQLEQLAIGLCEERMKQAAQADEQEKDAPIKAHAHSRGTIRNALGIKYSTLARWVQLSRPKHARPKPSLQLLEAVVESSPAHAVGALLALQLPGGVRVEVADEKQAALAAVLVRALAKRMA